VLKKSAFMFFIFGYHSLWFGSKRCKVRVKMCIFRVVKCVIDDLAHTITFCSICT
jgi:hypothetical protein